VIQILQTCSKFSNGLHVVKSTSPHQFSQIIAETTELLSSRRLGISMVYLTSQHIHYICLGCTQESKVSTKLYYVRFTILRVNPKLFTIL